MTTLDAILARLAEIEARCADTARYIESGSDAHVHITDDVPALCSALREALSWVDGMKYAPKSAAMKDVAKALGVEVRS